MIAPVTTPITIAQAVNPVVAPRDLHRAIHKQERDRGVVQVTRSVEYLKKNIIAALVAIGAVGDGHTIIVAHDIDSFYFDKTANVMRGVYPFIFDGAAFQHGVNLLSNIIYGLGRTSPCTV